MRFDSNLLAACAASLGLFSAATSHAVGSGAGYEAQVLDRDGVVVQTTFDSPVTPGRASVGVLGRNDLSVYETIEVGRVSYRFRTIGVDRGAVQVARSLDETQRVLDGLRARTVMLTLLVAGLAITVGLWMSARVTASLRRLTATAEHVGATGRLDATVGDGGTDEVGRLATAFDRMLVAQSLAEPLVLVTNDGVLAGYGEGVKVV